MFRGFYTAASGMLTQQRRTEILTNNLANVNTPGYKSDNASIRAFPEMLLQRLDSHRIPGSPISIRTSSEVGSVNTGVYVHETIPQFQQGDLYETNLPLDFALRELVMPETENGIPASIFFAVENPEGGELYTRNGNFTLDAEGYLTTANGFYVLDAEGNRIHLENGEFTTSPEGYIEQNGEIVARIGVAFAENANVLRKNPQGLFELEDGGALPSAYGIDGATFTVNQGYIERSNVDATKTMTELLSAYRTFEANQKVLQAYDQSMGKAVNEIGKL